MEVRKSFKYRLYPTKDTIEKLEWTLSRCCELYNAALQERKDAWEHIKNDINFFDKEKEKTKNSITAFDQQKHIIEVKNSVRPEYTEITAHVLNDVCARIDKAFQAFFKRVKKGQTPGYPRYKSWKRYDSFTYPDAGGWKLEGTTFTLSKISTKPIRIRLHRPVEGTIKTATIKREGNQWYVVFSCVVEKEPKVSTSIAEVGIDLGLLHFATLSNGETIENPRHLRYAEKRLAKAQQSLSKKKRGSKRRKKAVTRVATIHRKVRNQRRDFLQKASRTLVDAHRLIVFEDLATKNLVRRPKPKQDEETEQYLPNGAAAKSGLNKSITDAGWAKFVDMCSCKAVEAGITILRVDPKNTSQMCSSCGVKGEHKDLSVRTHTCVSCGIVLDRDHNAAINILARGRRAQAGA